PQAMSIVHDNADVIVAQSGVSDIDLGPHDELSARVDKLEADVELYRKLYHDALTRCRTLEKGLLTTQRERLDDEHKQLTLGILGTLLGGDVDEREPVDATTEASDNTDEGDVSGIEVESHVRRRSGGRRQLPEHLPRVQQTIMPDEVIAEGLDNFELIGKETSQTLERRT